MRATAVSAVLAVGLVAGLSSTAAAEDPTPTDTPTATETTSDPTPTDTTPAPDPTPTETTPAPEPSPTETTAEPSPTTTSGTSSPTKSAPKPTVQPGPVAPAGSSGYVEVLDLAPLRGSFLAAQIAAADRITATLMASTSKVAVATREMDQLAAKSNALLESLATARESERAATDEAAQARTDLVVLEARLETARSILREWVFSVYSGGGSNSDMAVMIEAMSAEPEDVGDPLGDLSYLTEQRTRAVEEVRVLTAEQVRLSAAAEASEAEASAARATIEKNTAPLDKVLREQRSRVEELRRLQIDEVQKAGPIASILVGARSPAARAAAARLRDALRAASADVTSIGEPCTNDNHSYPNGLFPPSALCPLWGAPGERLAPGPAAAFNALSKAYAAQTGTPLCVTDSYRSLLEQISIKGTRGRFAATPGTSRHGLGRALDLCGGVQDFGSPAHRWMVQHGPMYGWFHPAWAAAGGSLPEPWHFEYAG
ncbi:MAG TPA: M15 family metallopeptidase [Ornithinibacter sp.]|nr:M15 family metallopeptidase [Ornithinibacter sp.]